MRVSVVIPTFRRPRTLGLCLRSCLEQTGLAADEYEIIVVDNCPDRSARARVAAIAGQSATPVRYLAEPQPGPAAARNTGIAATAAPLVAMIDDDEYASPAWLANMLEVQVTFAADVVFGPVLPLLENPNCAHAAVARQMFTYSAEQPSGRIKTPFYSNNALIIKDRCFSLPHQFDPDIGPLGGEDTLYFHQLALDGRRLAWCAEGVVHELLPARRCTFAYLTGRSFQRGQTVPRTCAMLTPPRPRAVARHMVVGAGQFLVLGVSALALWCLRSPRAPQHAVHAFQGLGKFLWMRPFSRRHYGVGTEPPRSPTPLRGGRVR